MKALLVAALGALALILPGVASGYHYLGEHWYYRTPLVMNHPSASQFPVQRSAWYDARSDWNSHLGPYIWMGWADSGDTSANACIDQPTGLWYGGVPENQIQTCFYSLGGNGVGGQMGWVPYSAGFPTCGNAYTADHYCKTYVMVNSYYATSWQYSYARNIACHEMGHALGLGHQTAPPTNTCLRSYVQSGVYTPNSHDTTELNVNIYSAWDGDPNHHPGPCLCGGGVVPIKNRKPKNGRYFKEALMYPGASYFDTVLAKHEYDLVEQTSPFVNELSGGAE